MSFEPAPQPARPADDSHFVPGTAAAVARATTKLEVGPAGEGDLAGIVAIHLHAFDGFFLNMLGEKFLLELYRGFLGHASSICLKAEFAGELGGFVVGTVAPNAFFRQLLARRWYAFFFAALRGLACHPFFVARKLAGAVCYRGEAPGRMQGSGALLSSIAVSPASAGLGIGKHLLRGFCEAARSRGADYVYLITDRDHNAAVNEFYRKAGFSVESSFEKAGHRWMNRYVKRLREDPAGARR